MRKATSIAFTEEMLRAIDRHPLSKDASRSAFIRVCVSEKLEREKAKANKNETQSEK